LVTDMEESSIAMIDLLVRHNFADKN
jgi:hypothetical protein